MSRKIAFQGELGSYSHQACVEARPDFEPLPCATFEEAFEKVRNGEAEIGMIGVENSSYGRVADVHALLPNSGLFITDEVFVRVHINLLAVKGAKITDIKRVRAMSILLGQARGFIQEHGFATLSASDNAAGAREVAELADPSEAAFASEVAADLYGLDVLDRQIEDQANNTTRFFVMEREANTTPRGTSGMITSFVFRVRNIPAALYKAMGGFATNGVNMTKLESYMVGGTFTATQFYADIEGHPDEPAVARALEELGFFTSELKILGVYPADPRRK